jgi:hypothetical protein
MSKIRGSYFQHILLCMSGSILFVIWLLQVQIVQKRSKTCAEPVCIRYVPSSIYTDKFFNKLIMQFIILQRLHHLFRRCFSFRFIRNCSLIVRRHHQITIEQSLSVHVVLLPQTILNWINFITTKKQLANLMLNKNLQTTSLF